jgi:hypothetical protein
MTSLVRCALVALLLAPAACRHDLDKLRRGTEPGLRDNDDGGRGGSGSGSGSGGGDAPRDGGGGDSGSDAAMPPVEDACEPCPELTAQAMQLGLRPCCRGLAAAECGLTFGGGNLCLPRDAPGQPDTECMAITTGGMRLPGCCRPDGRCGVMAGATELGCVVRDQALAGMGSESSAPIACRYECETDDECNVLPGGFACAEHPLDGERFCADVCARDGDCSEELGHVCAFANDFAMDRVLAICRPSVGDVQPGETCATAEDCAHGVCVRVQGGTPYCSQLCRTAGDCPAGQSTCAGSNISRPSGTGDMLRFSICKK